MELCFAQYHICAGEKHLQETQVKDRKDRNMKRNKEAEKVKVFQHKVVFLFFSN